MKVSWIGWDFTVCFRCSECLACAMTKLFLSKCSDVSLRGFCFMQVITLYHVKKNCVKKTPEVGIV